MDKDIVEQNNEIISVGELNRSAKYLLESNFPAVSVIGEISNLARPASGHIYFSRKMMKVQFSARCLKGVTWVLISILKMVTNALSQEI